MINDQWLKRWQDKNIGFHRSDVNPILEANWSALELPAGSKVYVPLCGKSVDMAWLLAQGYQVIGVELSELAVLDFLESHEMTYTVTEHANYKAYQSNAITLYVGDLFELPHSLFTDVDAIYDRAAFIAMTPEQREEYVARFLDIQRHNPAVKLLLLTVEHDGQTETGPPFYISHKALKDYFGDYFTITRLDQDYKENLIARRFVDAGITEARGIGYILVNG